MNVISISKIFNSESKGRGNNFIFTNYCCQSIGKRKESRWSLILLSRSASCPAQIFVWNGARIPSSSPRLATVIM